MYVCMYVCQTFNVCMYARFKSSQRDATYPLSICICLCTYVRIYMCMYMCIHTYTHTYWYTYWASPPRLIFAESRHLQFLYTYIHTDVYTHTYTRTFIRIIHSWYVKYFSPPRLIFVDSCHLQLPVHIHTYRYTYTHKHTLVHACWTSHLLIRFSKNCVTFSFLQPPLKSCDFEIRNLYLCMY